MKYDNLGVLSVYLHILPSSSQEKGLNLFRHSLQIFRHYLKIYRTFKKHFCSYLIYQLSYALEKITKCVDFKKEPSTIEKVLIGMILFEKCEKIWFCCLKSTSKFSDTPWIFWDTSCKLLSTSCKHWDTLFYVYLNWVWNLLFIMWRPSTYPLELHIIHSN